jgi:hypothetical protein
LSSWWSGNEAVRLSRVVSGNQDENLYFKFSLIFTYHNQAGLTTADSDCGYLPINSNAKEVGDIF